MFRSILLVHRPVARGAQGHVPPFQTLRGGTLSETKRGKCRNEKKNTKNERKKVKRGENWLSI